MTMQVAFLKPYGDMKKGDIEWIPRSEAIKLYSQDIVIPAILYKAREDAGVEQKVVEETADEKVQKEKKSKLLTKKKRGRPKKKAVPKEVEARETADDNT